MRVFRSCTSSRTWSSVAQSATNSSISRACAAGLLLRKQTLEIDDFVADCAAEEQVRELVQDLNTRILDARRRGIDGPKIVIGEVDVERVVREWRERRAAS